MSCDISAYHTDRSLSADTETAPTCMTKLLVKPILQVKLWCPRFHWLLQKFNTSKLISLTIIKALATNETKSENLYSALLSNNL